METDNVLPIVQLEQDVVTLVRELIRKHGMTGDQTTRDAYRMLQRLWVMIRSHEADHSGLIADLEAAGHDERLANGPLYLRAADALRLGFPVL